MLPWLPHGFISEDEEKHAFTQVQLSTQAGKGQGHRDQNMQCCKKKQPDFDWI